MGKPVVGRCLNCHKHCFWSPVSTRWVAMMGNLRYCEGGDITVPLESRKHFVES